jgi:two-component system, LuxR family, response regulator FixJ
MQEAEIAARRPIVAVVDDDPAVSISLKFALELEGFAVRIFGSGAEFLEAGNADECDCVVVDHKMPDMSGLELIEKLHDREVLTPAILLVSNPNAAVSARAARGAIPVVEKPLFGNALVERIREACARGPA